MNEPRVYKQSPILFIFMLFIFGILFVGLIFSIGREAWYILLPFGLAFGLIFVVAIFSMTSKTIISDDEISTQNLLGTKTLRWSEINKISGWGNDIKLHHIDRGLTVSPSSRLPGYPEVVEWIGTKRPDLFNPTEYAEMSKSLVSTIFPPSIGLLMIGAGLFAYSQESDTLFPFLIFAILGLVFIGMAFTSPRTITLQGNSMNINYLLNQKTLLANEIHSIYLSFTQTRNGKNYFVAINLFNRKPIRVSGLSPNLPVVYLVLKNWHGKNKEIRQTTQQN